MKTEDIVSITAPPFKTSIGKVIPCKAVNRFLIDSFMASEPKVMPPTYEVVTAAGTKELHYHDEKSISTDEERAAYQAYEEEKARKSSEYNKNFYRLLVLYGTAVDMPTIQSWTRRQKSLGIQVPEVKGDDDVEGRDELYLHYLQTELFGVEEDATDLMAHILFISGTDKEIADQLQKSFRSAIQEARDRQHKAIRDRKLGKQLAVRRTRKRT